MALAQQKTDYFEQDPYASRMAAAYGTSPRQDPVVYGIGDPAVCGLSKAQVAHYEENGFLMIENLFSEEEAGALLSAASRQQTIETREDSPYVIREPGSRVARSIFHVHRINDIFKALAGDKRLVSVARFLLGSDVYMHQSRANLKPGFRGKEFYWHSDFETWHMEDGMPRMRALSCSISLTDNTPHNGPLMVIPGSHRHYVSCAGETPANHYQQSLRKQEYGVPEDSILGDMVARYGIEAPIGKAGSVVFFECNIMHGSNSNITPIPRTNMFFVYNSVENTLVEPYCGLAPRPEFVAERKDFSPLREASPDYVALVAAQQ